ncbi:MAG: malate dehydrogenase, partial [Myxococcales bacterium]|nr:malate dehydrogenase [Myxococcales bacterium]
TVQQRGAAIIKARGLSSAASAANAAIDHVHDWAGLGNGGIVSMAIPSDGSYGVPTGLVFSFPVRVTAPWKYEIVQGLPINDFSQVAINKTTDELLGEREFVKDMLG